MVQCAQLTLVKVLFRLMRSLMTQKKALLQFRQALTGLIQAQIHLLNVNTNVTADIHGMERLVFVTMNAFVLLKAVMAFVEHKKNMNVKRNVRVVPNANQIIESMKRKIVLAIPVIGKKWRRSFLQKRKVFSTD